MEHAEVESSRRECKTRHRRGRLIIRTNVIIPLSVSASRDCVSAESYAIRARHACLKLLYLSAVSLDH